VVVEPRGVDELQQERGVEEHDLGVEQVRRADDAHDVVGHGTAWNTATTSRGPRSMVTATAVRPPSVSACEPSAASGTRTTTIS
jgi:hypothetical protein